MHNASAMRCACVQRARDFSRLLSCTDNTCIQMALRCS